MDRPPRDESMDPRRSAELDGRYEPRRGRSGSRMNVRPPTGVSQNGSEIRRGPSANPEDGDANNRPPPSGYELYPPPNNRSSNFHNELNIPGANGAAGRPPSQDGRRGTPSTARSVVSNASRSGSESGANLRNYYPNNQPRHPRSPTRSVTPQQGEPHGGDEGSTGHISFHPFNGMGPPFGTPREGGRPSSSQEYRFGRSRAESGTSKQAPGDVQPPCNGYNNNRYNQVVKAARGPPLQAGQPQPRVPMRPPSSTGSVTSQRGYNGIRIKYREPRRRPGSVTSYQGSKLCGRGDESSESGYEGESGYEDESEYEDGSGYEYGSNSSRAFRPSGRR